MSTTFTYEDIINIGASSTPVETKSIIMESIVSVLGEEGINENFVEESSLATPMVDYLDLVTGYELSEQDLESLVNYTFAGINESLLEEIRSSYVKREALYVLEGFLDAFKGKKAENNQPKGLHGSDSIDNVRNIAKSTLKKSKAEAQNRPIGLFGVDRVVNAEQRAKHAQKVIKNIDRLKKGAKSAAPTRDKEVQIRDMAANTSISKQSPSIQHADQVARAEARIRSERAHDLASGTGKLTLKNYPKSTMKKEPSLTNQIFHAVAKKRKAGKGSSSNSTVQNGNTQKGTKLYLPAPKESKQYQKPEHSTPNYNTINMGTSQNKPPVAQIPTLVKDKRHMYKGSKENNIIRNGNFKSFDQYLATLDNTHQNNVKDLLSQAQNKALPHNQRIDAQKQLKGLVPNSLHTNKVFNKISKPQPKKPAPVQAEGTGNNKVPVAPKKPAPVQAEGTGNNKVPVAPKVTVKPDSTKDVKKHNLSQAQKAYNQESNKNLEAGSDIADRVGTELIKKNNEVKDTNDAGLTSTETLSKDILKLLTTKERQSLTEIEGKMKDNRIPVTQQAKLGKKYNELVTKYKNRHSNEATVDFSGHTVKGLKTVINNKKGNYSKANIEAAKAELEKRKNEEPSSEEVPTPSKKRVIVKKNDKKQEEVPTPPQSNEGDKKQEEVPTPPATPAPPKSDEGGKVEGNYKYFSDKEDANIAHNKWKSDKLKHERAEDQKVIDAKKRGKEYTPVPFNEPEPKFKKSTSTSKSKETDELIKQGSELGDRIADAIRKNPTRIDTAIQRDQDKAEELQRTLDLLKLNDSNDPEISKYQEQIKKLKDHVETLKARKENRTPAQEALTEAIALLAESNISEAGLIEVLKLVATPRTLKVTPNSVSQVEKKKEQKLEAALDNMNYKLSNGQGISRPDVKVAEKAQKKLEKFKQWAKDRYNN